MSSTNSTRNLPVIVHNPRTSRDSSTSEISRASLEGRSPPRVAGGGTSEHQDPLHRAPEHGMSSFLNTQKKSSSNSTLADRLKPLVNNLKKAGLDIEAPRADATSGEYKKSQLLAAKEERARKFLR